MALADGGAYSNGSGSREFGDDPTNDRLIRKYGYFGTPATLKAVEENDELKENLSVPAHLIHGPAKAVSA